MRKRRKKAILLNNVVCHFMQILSIVVHHIRASLYSARFDFFVVVIIYYDEHDMKTRQCKTIAFKFEKYLLSSNLNGPRAFNIIVHRCISLLQWNIKHK